MQSLSSSTALTLYHAPSLKLVQLPKSLVIVDAAIQNFSILVHSLDAAAELLVLEAHQDGIAQISSKLKTCSQLEHIHIIAPSCPGVIKLGKTCLDTATLETYCTEIEAWRPALNPHAQILLHGQTVVIGTQGMALVGRLSQLTGAVVAPSSLPISTSRSSAQPEFVPLAG